MSVNRRKVLAWGGLSGLGLALTGKWVWGQKVNSFSPEAVISEATEIAEDLTPTSAQPLLRFVSVADTGTGAQGQYAVAEAMTRYHQQKTFDLAVLAGDNIYNDGEIEKIGAVFERPYESLLSQGVKFHACLGNHDIRTDNGDPQVRYSAFNMQNRRYYTFRRDPVQFFALDTNDNADWQNQLVWLEQELSQSNAHWKVVFAHNQIYSSAHYGINHGLIKTLTPLFKKYGVQLYINGHDHVYERSKPIEGTTYLICGAGAGTRPVGRSSWTAYSAERLSFAAYEVYRDRIEISAIGTDRQVFDRGVISPALVS